ncbi:unnamed protein product [Trichogramma brassicae]|uniref:Uncharacterized protein n=1 Tax=Trichogramma brassicae TaxID=86971 RepID=A0A6H5IHT5_9HYME|nr:unnamed protein product [Trichogramma brassicae]
MPRQKARWRRFTLTIFSDCKKNVLSSTAVSLSRALHKALKAVLYSRICIAHLERVEQDVGQEAHVRTPIRLRSDERVSMLISTIDTAYQQISHAVHFTNGRLFGRKRASESSSAEIKSEKMPSRAFFSCARRSDFLDLCAPRPSAISLSDDTALSRRGTQREGTKIKRSAPTPIHASAQLSRPLSSVLARPFAISNPISLIFSDASKDPDNAWRPLGTHSARIHARPQDQSRLICQARVSPGMDRLQPPVERVRVWRCERFENHAQQTLEAGCAHVQQVMCSLSTPPPPSGTLPTSPPILCLLCPRLNDQLRVYKKHPQKITFSNKNRKNKNADVPPSAVGLAAALLAARTSVRVCLARVRGRGMRCLLIPTERRMTARSTSTCYTTYSHCH